MVDLKSEEDVEAWIEARPEATRHQDGMVLANRAAARVLPNLFSPKALKQDWFLPLTTTSFRALAAARLFALVPSRAAQEAARSAAFSAFSARSAALSTDSADSAAFSAALSAALSADSADSIDFADSADSAAFFAVISADSADSAAWAAINRDAALIEEQGAKAALLAPLPFLTWEGDTTAHPLRECWNAMKAHLLAQKDENWQVWVDWYERIVAGKSASLDVEKAYVFLDDPTLWEKGHTAVNAAIKKKLEEVEEPLTAPPPSPPTVPPQSPAAIEPQWNGDTLGLPTERGRGDLTDADLIAALRSLKDGLLETAKDAADESNLDRRITRTLNRLADKIPDAEVPPQHVIFTLGHAQEKLVDLQATVIEQASTALAADYQSLMRQFDRAVRQFPRWREYVRNAEKDTLTPDDIEAAKVAADDVNAILEDAVSWDVVGEDIRRAFSELDQLLGQAGNETPSEDTIRNGAELLALDVLESIENIAKRLAEKTLELGDDFKNHLEHDREALRNIWNSKTISDARANFRKGFAKQLNKESERLGTALAKVPRLFAKVAIVLMIGWAVGVGPVASLGAAAAGEVSLKLLKKFKWLKNFIDWLQS
jgi:Xaa-Pro aminopeptidase